MTENATRTCYLTTTDLHRLDLAVLPLIRMCRSGDEKRPADGSRVYLVGTVNERPDFRDVDVRLILPDDRFDALFGHSPALWGAFCYATSRWLSADTGLPIDFQVQRQTEANEKYGEKTRNPLTGGLRRFAGLGDATRFDTYETI